MTSNDRYTPIRCRLKRIAAQSVWIAVGSVGQREVNLPRSCLHGADETALDALVEGTETVLRVFAWKAHALNLQPARDANAAAGDLFGDAA